MRYAYEIVGCSLNGSILCVNCGAGYGDPIFLGDELADDALCENCHDPLSGDDETRTEREAREAREAALETEAEAARVEYIERSLRELDVAVAETEKALERKKAEARIKREALLRRLDEKD